jgi:O-antigen/teichoic acid export membrane protein
MNRDTESIFVPAFVLMSGRALGFAVAFLVPLILVRVFDQHDFGTYKQVFLIFGTLFGIAQFGMAQSLFYFMPGSPQGGGGYVANAMLAMSGGGLLCLFLLWAAQPAIADWLNNDDLIGLIPLVGVYLVLMLGSAALEIVMTVRKQHFRASCAFALTDLLRAILCVAPVLLFGGLESLLAGMIACALLRLAVTRLYLHREFGRGFTPGAAQLDDQLRYAGPFALAVVFETLQVNLHMYVVAYQFDAAAFAIYAVGFLQIPLVDLMMSSTANVMMVRMQEHLRVGRLEAALAVWHQACRTLALAFFPLVAGLLVIGSDLIVLLFSASYADSVPIFMIWTTSFLFATFVFDAVLRVFAQIRFLVFVKLAMLLVVAGSIGPFMERFGLPGAALSTLLAIAAASLMALLRIRTLAHCGLATLLPWRVLVSIMTVAVAAAVPALAVKWAVHGPLYAVLPATALAYAASYCALMLLWGPLGREEKLLLTAWAHRPVVQFCQRWLG